MIISLFFDLWVNIFNIVSWIPIRFHLWCLLSELWFSDWLYSSKIFWATATVDATKRPIANNWNKLACRCMNFSLNYFIVRTFFTPRVCKACKSLDSFQSYVGNVVVIHLLKFIFSRISTSLVSNSCKPISVSSTLIAFH